MKKPDYMGEQEFAHATASLHDRFAPASSLAADLAWQADASYNNRELGAVPAQLRLNACQNRYRAGRHFQLLLKVTLSGLRVEQSLKIGTEDEIRALLAHLSSAAAARDFLFELYRDLSDLDRG